MKYLYLLFFISVFASCNNKKVKENTPQKNEVEKDTIIKVKEETLEEPELIFTVQIAALSSKSEHLASLENIKIYEENKLTKYRFGTFESYEIARVSRLELIAKYKGAFIQALKNGKPIHIKEALSY